MNQRHGVSRSESLSRVRTAMWLAAILGAVCGLLFVSQAGASDHDGKLTEEFHQTYSLTPNGRLELQNINGPVHITAWDRNEVKLDAVKSANSKERLDEAKIQVDAATDRISIRTEYPHHDRTFNNDGWDNPASVEYTLTVPRGVSLDEVNLINGELDLTGLTGEVQASCINGTLNAQGLAGRVKLSTINGRLQAQFEKLGSSPVELSSVNGGLSLTLPSDAKAELEASTVHGGISNDFGLRVDNHRWIGHDLRGELGGGGTRIHLDNVNGRIEIRHAADGRAMSPAKNSGNSDDDEI
ncbi:MAG TPA: hypothetical protein VMH85_07175 [Terriglobales bacterium]|nr:hypothetical protein [Terriglobales bacterium]